MVKWGKRYLTTNEQSQISQLCYRTSLTMARKRYFREHGFAFLLVAFLLQYGRFSLLIIPKDYEERLYAGVLGKIIGVYLGRPFENWTYDQIMADLGEINYYVHERLNKPLIVTDDDISGTFTFSGRWKITVATAN